MPQILTRIHNEYLDATVSTLGAELQSLVTADGCSVLWDGNPEHWSGRSPLLFPIIGRAAEDHLVIDGQDFRMAQHGFARRSTFALIRQDDTSCSHLLVDNAATRAVYPFAFRLIVSHSLSGPVLRVQADVTNEDTRPMPFQLGFHPAFRWPLPGAAGDHVITLENGAAPALARLQHGLLSPARAQSPFQEGTLVLDPALFADDAMIFPEGAGERLRYAADFGPVLDFRFENLPNIALWTKHGARFVCIEPWHGLPATTAGDPDILSRPFVKTLSSGEEAQFAWELRL